MTKKSFNASVLPRMRAFASRLVGRGDAVLVGLSGGADSVCLLHFLRYLAGEKHFLLAAVHVNHGLRGREAAQDQRFCKNLCKELGIEFITQKTDAKKVAKKLDLSPEHGARKARYDAFVKAARKWGANKLALGHHLDDQAETVLLNLLRGTKAKGLAGIPVRRPLAKDVEIVRPLLCVTRAETEAYLQNNGLEHVTDRTNFDDAFTRNWVRGTLLPLLATKQPQIKHHLALIAADVEKILERGVGK
ncbi:tRNA lysidine(34) synthetase TilS [Candidatus Avelusimicrobium alvi]|uniref:tRNA lysidine(34) synthetase TilS n=1 Tax=Candidatus Avelusimicrobium alvi TaxID=3416221 RepID=UPI003D0BD665